MKQVKLMQGDNMESLKKLPDNSIDSVVTDPPYGLSFMNKRWDYDVPRVDFWKEVYRVLKPGGHVLSFGGTRTYHRMVVNIEDAGFEIRDQIQWIYGSGFPKSLNVGKIIEKYKKTGNASWNGTGDSSNGSLGYSKLQKEQGYRNDDYSNRHQSKIEINNEWEGWGTALKPANEPICLARKPLSEKSVAENVLKWRTGGINVDGCRVGTDDNLLRIGDKLGNRFANFNNESGEGKCNVETGSTEGRFPANIILECICDEVIKGEKGEIKKSSGSRKGLDITHEWGYGEINRTNFTDKGDIHTNPNCPCRLLDEQSGESKSVNRKFNSSGNTFIKLEDKYEGGYTDKGGASRFFYQAKVSKAERNMGLDGFEEKEKDRGNALKCGNCGLWVLRASGESCKCGDDRIELKGSSKNHHPTVKPINLMTYLCRLITPENGIVLDPFMGSGSTGVAAQLEGFRFVGMEMDNDYFKIAEARINSYEKYRKFLK